MSRAPTLETWRDWFFEERARCEAERRVRHQFADAALLAIEEHFSIEVYKMLDAALAASAVLDNPEIAGDAAHARFNEAVAALERS